MKITLTKKDKNTLKAEIINANGVFLKLEQIAISFKDYLLGNSKTDILNDLFAEGDERLKAKDENGRKDPRYQRIEYLCKLAKGDQGKKEPKDRKALDSMLERVKRLFLDVELSGDDLSAFVSAVDKELSAIKRKAK